MSEAKDTVIKNVPAVAIRIDGGTQSRTKINIDAVEDYAAKMADGVEFPPVVVFFDGKDHWLADGFHRYHALRKIQKASVRCQVQNGTVRDAILYSFGANGMHGLPMTNEDKWHIVTEMVGDFEWSEWSDREISRRCHVSHIFVAKVRSSVGKADEVIEKAQESSSEEVGRKYVDKHGNVSTMKPASKKREAVKEEEPPAEPSVPAAEADKLQETIEFLIKENEALTDKLAAGSSDDPEFTARTIEELRDENKQLRIEVKSLTISRDQFQAENAQLMKQVNYLTKKLKKFEA
jgi:hypothetical protein